MKYFLGTIAIIFFCSFNWWQDIYSIPLKSIDGKQIDLSSYKGKKILFIILPVSDADTSVNAADIAAVQKKYAETLVIIGIPAQESGFKKENVAKLRSSYVNSSRNFILSEIMNVQKVSGAAQSPIFQWLTDKKKNQHYDTDVQGAGHKFFVNEQGVLYAVVGPRVKLSYPVIDKILSKTPGISKDRKPFPDKQ